MHFFLPLSYWGMLLLKYGPYVLLLFFVFWL